MKSSSVDALIYRRIRETIAPETCSRVNAAVAYIQRTLPQVDEHGARNLQYALETLEHVREVAGKLREALKETMRELENTRSAGVDVSVDAYGNMARTDGVECLRTPCGAEYASESGKDTDCADGAGRLRACEAPGSDAGSDASGSASGTTDTMDRLFYVTCFPDEGTRGPLYITGPFATHEAAEESCHFWRALLPEMYPRAHWYLYGTASVLKQDTQPCVVFDRSSTGHVLPHGWAGPEKDPACEGEQFDGCVASRFLVLGEYVWVWSRYT